ncbi:MAG: transcription-repair coupling factor [Lentisphaerales bacterium]|nr:transcription-repair coupling factor [Lentisphaerales bacterium]
MLDTIFDDFKQFLKISGDSRPVFEFPEYATSKGLFQPDNEGERNTVLGKLLTSQEPMIILASSSAFISPVAEVDQFNEDAIELKVGDESYSPESLSELLVKLDYDNEYQVSMQLEFARRGGIVDIFSPLYKNAHRIEFFGDEIESIRAFDPATQRSIEEAESLTVVPRSSDEQERGHLLDYCKAYTTILLDPESIEKHVEEFFRDCSFKSILEKTTVLNIVNGTSNSLAISAMAPFFRSSLPELHGAVSIMIQNFVKEQLQNWVSEEYELFIFCGSKGNRQRFEQLLKETGIAGKGIHLTEDHLAASFICYDSKQILLSENELFGRSVTTRRSRSVRQQALEAFLESEPEISTGDYAVHAAHGICRYNGIEIQENNGLFMEVMALEFAEERMLYVPLTSSHLISRYIGGRKGVPKLTRIGGSAWKAARGKAESTASDLAAELLRFQAVRKFSKGHRCTEDNDWQMMFEEAFPYEETVDQKKAIEAVKKDMESSQPMDRLVCGDVGFGKTEVALRAAFKAVMDGRQVAVIVPTTVLAQQHYRTFSQRMADYPVDVRLLCRFVSGKEQKQTLKDMAEGGCDIVIGTHRLLQKDILFECLGLVVVDEEQRFGVESKEQLKRMRATVDILTMTATPIPRTLYFSLAGLRDFSTIMTPPVERKPVKTIVAKEDDEIIEQALKREIERGGQVYFLHNRVQTIEKKAFQIQQMVPEAKVVFGHGQMKDSELEDVMRNFIERKYDILVSTTIIESGLDNPYANTIIIDRADRFGLAELYQLRGRVGRYHHQAYCYLLLPGHGLLMDSARQRMSAIRRYTHLGAGFKLALRDLEIRGAGNLLGKEQSGHIAAVGFEMYCKLLKSSVARLENKKEPLTVTNVSIDFLPIGMSEDKESACIPPEYIESQTIRLETYQRTAKLDSLKLLNEFCKELRDRFGRFPKTVSFYMKFLEIKVRAQLKRLHAVAVRDGRLYLEGEEGYKKINGKVPVLSEGSTTARLNEILQLLKRI